MFLEIYLRNHYYYGAKLLFIPHQDTLKVRYEKRDCIFLCPAFHTLYEKRDCVLKCPAFHTVYVIRVVLFTLFLYGFCSLRSLYSL